MTPEMRNRLGFMVLGLCNNFSFCIMLSAANDLMAAPLEPNPEDALLLSGNSPDQEQALSTSLNLALNLINSTQPLNSSVAGAQSSPKGEKLCNPISTSAVLLADIIPALLIQMLYPMALVHLPGQLKLITAVALAACSFVTTGYSTTFLPIMAGTCAASVAYGLGESTFLSTSIRYGPGALVGWSVGTGFAGIISASTYAVLRTILPIKHTMCIMLILPVLMLATFYFVLVPMDSDESHSKKLKSASRADGSGCNEKANYHFSAADKSGTDNEDNGSLHKSIVCVVKLTPGKMEKQLTNLEEDTQSVAKLDARTAKDLEANAGAQSGQTKGSEPIVESLGAKLRFCLIDLIPFFVPMALVYFSAYFINQGLTELFYFREFTSLSMADQYRWLQVAYQMGSLLSRCSILFFRFPYLWLMASLQPLNLALVMAHSLRYIQLPGFLSVAALVFYEGLITGFCYANTYFNMREDLDPRRQPLAISVVAVFNSIGVLLAALLALPTHNKLCEMYEIWTI